MPVDPHVTHFDWERGSENGDAISVDVRKELVLNGFTLEQDAYRWVTAKNEGLVEPEKLGWSHVIRIDTSVRLETYCWGREQSLLLWSFRHVLSFSSAKYFSLPSCP